jgi:hypothetical protein
MPSSIKKEFNYSVTNLDWGDGSELEFTENPKLFDRLESLEHTYEMPGFYTIKGLVYKKALELVNIYPPIEEDSSIPYNQIELENNDASHDFPNKSPIKALLSSVDEETYLGFNNLDYNRSGSAITLNPSPRGGYLINETFRSGTDIEIVESEDEFDRTIAVKIPSKGQGGNLTNTINNAILINNFYGDGQDPPESGDVDLNIGTTRGYDNVFILTNSVVDQSDSQQYAYTWEANILDLTAYPDLQNRTRNAGIRFNMGLELDVDRNSYFEVEFDAWLPNYGRLEIIEPSDAPENPPENYLPQSLVNAINIHDIPGSPYNIETYEAQGGQNIHVEYYEITEGYNDINSYEEFYNSISNIEPGTSETGLGFERQYTGIWNPGGQVWRISWNEESDPDTGQLSVWSTILFEINDDYSDWNRALDTISEDGQWIWFINPDYPTYQIPGWYRDPNFEFTFGDSINNPTKYLLEIRLTPEDEEVDDHREQFFFSGTNDWQTIKGDFFATSKNYKSMYVEFRQLDKDLDAINDNDPWKFYIKNIEMKIQNTNNIKFPLQWERFKSNIVLNSAPDYDSPFFEKNDFFMIGGMSKKSYYYKSLSSLVGYDFNADEKKENYSYAKYNPYDVILGLDTLAKFDAELYDEYLDPYSFARFDNNDNKITNGMINKRWHSSFKDTGLTDTDITSVRVSSGVKPMWRHLGFANEEFDKPNRNIYWKNIIPKDFNLSNREGITQRDLPDPMKGALTPRIPRKEFIVDEEATQYWNDGYYWPALPKFNKYGGFSDEYPEGTENQTYGDSDSPITSLDNNDTNVFFNLSITDDDIVDTLDNHDIKLNVDFTLELNSSNRMVKSMEDFSGTVETNDLKQAF